MKNFRTFYTVILCLFLFNAASAQQTNLGFVWQLGEIKFGTENFLNAVMGNSKVTPESKEEVAKMYNDIRKDMNKLLYQLTADMRIKNSAKPYKKLNAYYQNHDFTISDTGELKLYTEAFKSLDTKYKVLLNLQVNRVKADKSFESIKLADIGITEAATFIWTVIKESSELREKKVSNVTSILEALMIDAIAPKEEKEAK